MTRQHTSFISGSAITMIGCIATVLLAWPEISAFMRWSIGTMDAPTDINDMRQTEQSHFETINSNLVRMDWRLLVIEKRLLVLPPTEIGYVTNKQMTQGVP